MKIIGIKLIHAYRYLASPWVGNQCRFYPTCSHYAEEAIEHYGLLKGSALAAKRLLKCHPWHPGGIDFVPGTVNEAADSDSSDETSDSITDVTPGESNKLTAESHRG
ncbi:membrane protein insertion efficiency factor YidD [Aestuariicella sp. G3-2]|uniref:membrane protein insertion efficiency factor YidD n=1 Tax=Pseudomaricurvus albidus TaxID=2842452 RepID=UPI001C0ACBAC|nr:membrane protein insertion efficiency factor YidD [Aestuariicella albida]MBU3068666.1 membrane protein insertion efficiency factor YidD [Aestuariicella albida]